MAFDRRVAIQGWPAYEGLVNNKTGALWTPLEVAGAAWLDATDASTLSLTGSSVDRWTIKGLGGSVSQSVAGAKPSYGTTLNNGKPVVSFDGGDRLIATSFTFAQPFTIAIVGFIAAADTDAAMFIDNYDAATGAAVYRGKAADQPNNIALNYGATIGATQPTYPSVITVVLNGSSSSIQFNGGSNAVSGNAGTNGYNSLSIGDLRGNPNPIDPTYALNGWIQHIAIIPGTSADNLARLQGWAAWDAGLQDSLPSDHPFKNSPPFL